MTFSIPSLLRRISANPAAAETVTPEQRRLINRYVAGSVRERQAKIATLRAAGKLRSARRKQSEMLSSLTARLEAADRASRKSRPRQGVSRGFQEIWRVAQALRSMQKPASPFVRLKQKRTGGIRPICQFGLEDRARQYLMRSALNPFVGILPAQYGLRRGRSAACEALLQAMGTAPSDDVFVQVDIRGFYSAIAHEWLEENLPLPRGVIPTVIHTGGMRMVPRRLARPVGEAIRELGRRGIPQGSAASSLVAEFVVADILRGMADLLQGSLVVNYSDNIGLLMHRETWEARAIVEPLRRALLAHPAGPFETTMSRPRPITMPFKFLGYCWIKGNAGAHAYVDPEALDERVTLYRSELDLYASVGSEEALRHLQRTRAKAASYASAFALCPETQRRVREILDESRELIGDPAPPSVIPR